ncbi:hypothetical protein QBC41DRAFT_324073 [Cercophora samala]|uniref:Uncharacterized protein n=1 Tax=Cercophora samala TaxID=330535 RepID=A0AA39ZBI6_9PEZI|nr:hypothetical protein QBC41DRAFT_324073 [Cercophora samala]
MKFTTAALSVALLATGNLQALASPVTSQTKSALIKRDFELDCEFLFIDTTADCEANGYFCDDNGEVQTSDTTVGSLVCGLGCGCI